MIFRKTALAALLLSALALADKKIELQDIEEDNLKNENDKKQDEPNEYKSRPTIVVTGGDSTGRAADAHPLDYIKNGFLRLYETPVQIQQPRFVQQYAVTENQERTPGVPETAVQKPEYAASGPGQTMLGYLSNVPMQILYIPQYYTEPAQASAHAGIQYAAPVGKINVGSYQAQENPEQQQSYIEVPTYLAPSGKGYAAPMQQYAPQVTYVTYGPPRPTALVGPTPLPSVTRAHHVGTGPTGYATAAAAPAPYAMPLVAYPQPVLPSPLYRSYYASYPQYETNSVEEAPSSEPEPQKEYAAPTERPYAKPTADSTRYYTSSQLLQGERGQPSQISQLPPPSPLIYESQPSHLAGIPKVLPYYRPSSKPVYSHISGNLIPGTFSPKHRDLGYGYQKKRPTSLLDSYVPSSVQLEYMKRGLGRDPVSTYEALSGRYSGPQPRHLERGFLPNQMYHTASGGVTYGHYKRTPNSRITQKVHQ